MPPQRKIVIYRTIIDNIVTELYYLWDHDQHDGVVWRHQEIIYPLVPPNKSFIVDHEILGQHALGEIKPRSHSSCSPG